MKPYRKPKVDKSKTYTVWWCPKCFDQKESNTDVTIKKCECGRWMQWVEVG